MSGLIKIISTIRICFNIVRPHVKPAEENSKVTLKAYIFPYKLSSVFSTRPIK